mgnify:CR=1 FL=1
MARWVSVVLIAMFAAPVYAAVPKAAPGTENQSLKPQDLQAMSLEEMLSKGEKAVAEMNAVIREVLDALTAAKKTSDFAKMNCIGTALSSIKGLLRITDQNTLALREFVMGRDRAGAEHEYVKIHIAREKVRDLAAQARSCGGPSGDTVFGGQAVVEQDFSEDLPREDVRVALTQPVFSLDPPPSASPFY